MQSQANSLSHLRCLGYDELFCLGRLSGKVIFRIGLTPKLSMIFQTTDCANRIKFGFAFASLSKLKMHIAVIFCSVPLDEECLGL